MEVMEVKEVIQVMDKLMGRHNTANRKSIKGKLHSVYNTMMTIIKRKINGMMILIMMTYLI